MQKKNILIFMYRVFVILIVVSYFSMLVYYVHKRNMTCKELGFEKFWSNRKVRQYCIDNDGNKHLMEFDCNIVPWKECTATTK